MRIVERDFYRRDPRTVAPELLNKLLVRRGTADADGPESVERVGRIVEVEAYCGGIDPGSHAYRGMTARNRTMFGPPGGLYVYFTYGMHWCANAVCGEEGEGVAVLLRALAPVAGLDAMRAVRPGARRDQDLCSGPAKLCQALGLGRAFDGADLVTGDRGVVVCDDGTPPPADAVQTTRIGLRNGAEHPWRWYVPGEPNVSRPRLPVGPRRKAMGGFICRPGEVIGSGSGTHCLGLRVAELMTSGAAGRSGRPAGPGRADGAQASVGEAQDGMRLALANSSIQPVIC